MSELKDLLDLDVSPKALHQVIERMPSIQMTAARTGQARKWVLTRTVTETTTQPRDQSASDAACRSLTLDHELLSHDSSHPPANRPGLHPDSQSVTGNPVGHLLYMAAGAA